MRIMHMSVFLAVQVRCSFADPWCYPRTTPPPEVCMYSSTKTGDSGERGDGGFPGGRGAPTVTVTVQCTSLFLALDQRHVTQCQDCVIRTGV
ncbi:hypothetical protein F5J12DRAFT_863633, partial [Pisolithus orientalis]|uniref:uncharacterized protein n=1 Tax=Pisolithus orientalis TaxID=936130 RepID=UPI0022254814